MSKDESPVLFNMMLKAYKKHKRFYGPIIINDRYSKFSYSVHYRTDFTEMMRDYKFKTYDERLSLAYAMAQFFIKENIADYEKIKYILNQETDLSSLIREDWILVIKAITQIPDNELINIY